MLGQLLINAKIGRSALSLWMGSSTEWHSSCRKTGSSNQKTEARRRQLLRGAL